MNKVAETVIYCNFNLPVYIEQELGVRLQKIGEGKFKCSCPFPFHKDSKPSFSIDFKNGGWVWYCYGCAAGGTSIQFFQKYYGIQYSECIDRICKIANIETDLSSYLSALGSTVDTDRIKKEMESNHIDLCVKCRDFMRDFPGDRETVKWVKSIYRRANEILESSNMDKMKELLKEVSEHTQ